MASAGITPSTLTAESFNAWLSSVRRTKTTVANYRRMALTLWRFAARLKIAPSISDEIMEVKQRAKIPVCWTDEELRTLMATASKQVGRFKSRCPKALFWRAWILVGYETGIRFADLHNLTQSQLRGNRLYIIHHKTGVPQGKQLSNLAVSLVRELLDRSPDKTVFRWALGRRAIFVSFKKLAEQAKLEGTTKWLRRSGATYVEKERPGSAKAFLGHLSDGLARKYYVDPTILSEDIPVPPPFTDTDSRKVAVAG